MLQEGDMFILQSVSGSSEVHAYRRLMVDARGCDWLTIVLLASKHLIPKINVEIRIELFKCGKNQHNVTNASFEKVIYRNGAMFFSGGMNSCFRDST
jgi:hypothetical protein